MAEIDTRPRTTVLAGHSPAATAAVARCLQVARPALQLVSSVPVDGSGDRLLALPAEAEPEDLATLLGATGATVDSYVTVVEAARFLDELTGADREVTGLISRQVEFADTILVWGHPGLGAFESGRLAALLHRLAPWAVQVRAGDTARVDCTGLAAQLLGRRRHDPAVPGARVRALEGYPIGVHDPAGDHGVNAFEFRSRRPLHAGRLRAALGRLAGEPLRGRGHLWLAERPDTVIGWESSGGGVAMGNLGSWLDAVPPERWPETSVLRRLAADATWDPYFGDRSVVLSFVGLGLDVEGLTTVLDRCLLTDAELSAGISR